MDTKDLAGQALAAQLEGDYPNSNRLFYQVIMRMRFYEMPLPQVFLELGHNAGDCGYNLNSWIYYQLALVATHSKDSYMIALIYRDLGWYNIYRHHNERGVALLFKSLSRFHNIGANHEYVKTFGTITRVEYIFGHRRDSLEYVRQCYQLLMKYETNVYEPRIALHVLMDLLDVMINLYNELSPSDYELLARVMSHLRVAMFNGSPREKTEFGTFETRYEALRIQK